MDTSVQGAHLVYENNQLDPPYSHAWAFTLEGILLAAVVFCVVEIRRARRAAQGAARALRPGTSLYEGMRFVSGIVEFAQGESAAVSVTVAQAGTEHSTKNGKYHRWEEYDRETESHPFYLKHESGARIRVEPPEDVLLVDRLDQTEWIERAKRRLRAELAPGERAIVEGILRRERDPEAHGENIGYRQAASEGWVMKPQRNGGMHISTEDLEKRHVLRKRALQAALIWLVIAGAIAQAPMYTYVERLLLGHTVMADYAGKSSYQTRDSKGRTTTHYIAKIWHSTRDGKRDYIDAEVDHTDYLRLPSTPAKMWIRQVERNESATALGRGSSLSLPLALISTLILGIGIWGVVRSHRYRRWYEGRVKSQESGELPMPTMVRFRADVAPKQKKKRA